MFQEFDFFNILILHLKIIILVFTSLVFFSVSYLYDGRNEDGGRWEMMVHMDLKMEMCDGR